MDTEAIRKIVMELLAESADSENNVCNQVPVEVSGRHVHLSQEDVERLFGKGHILKPKRELSQPGQFLCEERVKLVTEKSQIENVAVLGPARNSTQAELSKSDARTLGINAPLKLSGDLKGASDVVIIAGDNCIFAKESVIIAKNHIHMTPKDAERFFVSDGQKLSVSVRGERFLIFEDVIVRIDPNFSLAMHIDTDEANACMLPKNAKGKILYLNGRE